MLHIILLSLDATASHSHRWNGPPRPRPHKFAKLVFRIHVLELILHLSKLVIWGSSWGRGFRFHWLVCAYRTDVDLTYMRLVCFILDWIEYCTSICLITLWLLCAFWFYKFVSVACCFELCRFLFSFNLFQTILYVYLSLYTYIYIYIDNIYLSLSLSLSLCIHTYRCVYIYIYI